MRRWERAVGPGWWLEMKNYKKFMKINYAIYCKEKMKLFFIIQFEIMYFLMFCNDGADSSLNALRLYIAYPLAFKRKLQLTFSSWIFI